MKITMLAMHRKEQYSGEYAPEIMSIVDEVTMDENPQWWGEEIERQKALIGSEASAWAEIAVEVSTEAIMAALYPAAKSIPATVITN